jgi:predicted Fe-Mo cluster-binding NifX family protein
MAAEKIAFVCDDADTLSAHFGRAPKVVVITLDDGNEVSREIRDKEFHGQHNHEEHGHDHGGMFAPMADCQVMVVRGMGSPALAHAESMGLKVFLVEQKLVNEALRAYQDGTLINDPRRLHQH